MKELLVIRHAKSSWQNARQDDFDRPLNERGKKDAPFMADEILKKDISIDLLISSDAKRAADTCQYFAEVFRSAKVVKEPALYQASIKNFYEVIHHIDDAFDCVAVFSHNTGLTDFVNNLCKVHVDIVPTCGIFAIKSDAMHWSAFKQSRKAFWFFDYPKNHLIR